MCRGRGSGRQNGDRLRKLRAILDVLITSRPALTNKAEAVQAFHDAWFAALKVMIDTPDQAEQAMIDGAIASGHSSRNRAT